jgi:hypothetical protein
MKYAYYVGFVNSKPGLIINYGRIIITNYKIDCPENYKRLTMFLKEKNNIEITENNFAITSLSFLHEIIE